MDFINAFTVSLQAVVDGSGFVGMTSGNVIMIVVGLVLLYLAFARDFEPLLLSPIAFGCILANIPFNGFEEPGVMSAIGMGIKYEIFPPLMPTNPLPSITACRETVNALIKSIICHSLLSAACAYPVCVRSCAMQAALPDGSRGSARRCSHRR